MKNFIILLNILFFLNTYNISYAADTDKGGDIATKVICNIAGALSGPISQGIATLVIIITGYSFFVGKVSIGMLFIVTGGIVLVFGSETIMSWILGNKAFKCQGGEILDPDKSKG